METGKMKQFALIMAGILALLTIFLFPTSEPGAIMILSSGEIAAKTEIVTLTPAFGRGSRNELYSFRLAPNLDKYAEDVSASDTVMLVATSSEIDGYGNTSSDWSFAWGYWILTDVTTSAILACAAQWILRRRNILSPSTVETELS